MILESNTDLEKSHKNADALSRRPCKDDCKHCHRVEKVQGMVTVNTVKIDIPDDWNKEILRKEQLDDKDIGPILRAKEKGTRQNGRTSPTKV